MERRGYPPEFRRRVLDLVATGRRVADVARDLGISEQSIYTWRRQDRIHRGLEPGLTSGEKAELVAARRRIAESTANSPAPGATSCGSPTSPSTPPARARSTARSCWTPTPAEWSAGPSTPHTPRRWNQRPGHGHRHPHPTRRRDHPLRPRALGM
jgi:transposase-like protein